MNKNKKRLRGVARQRAKSRACDVQKARRVGGAVSEVGRCEWHGGYRVYFV